MLKRLEYGSFPGETSGRSGGHYNLFFRTCLAVEARIGTQKGATLTAVPALKGVRGTLFLRKGKSQAKMGTFRKIT